jgi:hypothetical protein
MRHDVVPVASSRLGTLVIAIIVCSSSCFIVALCKFGSNHWSFLISDEVGVLLLEPGNQGNWIVSFVIIARGD